MQEAKVVRLPVLTSLALVAEIGAIAAQATNRVTLPLQLQLPPYVASKILVTLGCFVFAAATLPTEALT